MISTSFKAKGVTCLWHFTDTRNLEAIREHGGLLPLLTLRERGLQIPAPGGNELSHHLDNEKGLDRYVHCCFLRKHPMCYCAERDGRIVRTQWLKIDVEALDYPGVMFTSDVANKEGVELLTPGKALEAIDWEVLFTRTDWKQPEIQDRLQKAEKSEILLPREVPVALILNI